MQFEKCFTVLLLAVALTASPPRPLAEESPAKSSLKRQRLENSVHLHTQLLCGAVFVSGRDATLAIEQDLQWAGYTFHDWRKTTWRVDRRLKRVSLRNTEGASPVEASAIYHPGHGCTLLPAGATQVAFDYEAPVPPSSSAPLTEAKLSKQQTRAVASWLDRVFQTAQSEDSGDAQQNTRAIVVLQSGKLVAERYADGFDRHMPMLGWSMGKSVAAALLGVFAAEREGFHVDSRAMVTDWAADTDPRAAISSRHLLNMSSGLQFANPGKDDPLYYSDAHQHESVYFKPQDTRKLVLSAALAHAPGSMFAYRNTNTLGIMALIREGNAAQNQDHLVWPYRALFGPIGASSFVLEKDHRGNFVISGLVYATARDWARMGQFFLNAGKVNGSSLWPDNWQHIVTSPSAAAPFYGGQVWLNTQKAFKSVPPDAYYFLGWLDQIVLVVPSMNLVVVRLGFSDQGGFREYFDGLLESLLDTLQG